MEWNLDVNYEKGVIALKNGGRMVTWVHTDGDTPVGKQLVRAFNVIVTELNDLELEVSIHSEIHHE